jgi:hypothetical protein
LLRIDRGERSFSAVGSRVNTVLIRNVLNRRIFAFDNF